MDTEKWNSDYEYLIIKYTKLKLFPISITNDDNGQIKTFKGWLIPLHSIPRCTTCQADNKKYFALNQMQKNKFKTDCIKYCLWFDYFKNIRNQTYEIKRR